MTKKLVGIQIGGVSFLDEGVDEVLEILQTKGAVNALMLNVQAIADRGVAGRQLPGQPFPDHGIQTQDEVIGGSYFTPHAQYYAGTVLPAFRAPDPLFQGVDVLDMVLPKAHERDIKVYTWIYENPYGPVAGIVPNWPKVLEVDVYGRRTQLPCFHNPDYANWWFSIAEDLVKSYPIDGVQYGSERRGPLGDAIVGAIGTRPRTPGCFCEHCRAYGRSKGINVERAREGFRTLHEWLTKIRGGKGERPVDGYMVTFLRILLRYPEILAWEMVWHEGAESVKKGIYGTIKAIKPELPVGWHIWHTNSFSPLFRAEMDFSLMKHYSDFIKPVVYHNCAGPRFARSIKNLTESIWADTSNDLLNNLYQGILGYKERSWGELPTSGFSGEYVRSETERTVKGVNNEIPIYPGIDVDIPTAADETKMEPEDVKDGIRGAFAGGASGIILSRKYSEMWLKNLAAAGEVVRELGYA